MFYRLFFLVILLLSSSAFAYERGDWVLARWQGGQYWFPGVVERVEGGRVTVAYDDGAREVRPASQVKAYDWDIGSRVECRWASGQNWYAGRISDVLSHGATIRVLYADGDREQTNTALCRSR